MLDRAALSPTARSVLELARRDRQGALGKLAELSTDEQVALVCEAPLSRRGELLGLLPRPEAVIPRIPEAELCFTVKAVGVPDASWILACASEEQITACVDLDAWQGDLPDRAALDTWIDSLAEAGPDTILRAMQALDPEIVVHFLQGRVDVALKPGGDDDWQPPEGGQTLDGQFYFVARKDDDDLAAVMSALRVLFERDYWTYFRMMQGVMWELGSDVEEWALRWRAGRLEDLGFPPWERAMSIYGYLPPGALASVPPDARPLETGSWHLPVWMTGLPVAPESEYAIFRAMAELDERARSACFYAFVALANKVAVADRMPLSDAESVPRAIEKAARIASRGLEFVAAENGLDPAEALRRVPTEYLFRVGANLDPDSSRPPPPPPDEE